MVDKKWERIKSIAMKMPYSLDKILDVTEVILNLSITWSIDPLELITAIHNMLIPNHKGLKSLTRKKG